MATSALFEQMIDESSEKKNYGAPWTKEEEDKLLQEINENKTVDQISKDHKRSVGGILGKISTIAKKMHDNGKSRQDIEKTLKLLNKDMLNKALFQNKEKQNGEVKKKKIENLLTSINEIKSTLNLLVELELKRNNMKRDDFAKSVENDMKKYNKSNEEILSSSDEDDFEWTDAILSKMKKHKDNKEKLKEIRKKHDISKDVFNVKIASFE